MAKQMLYTPAQLRSATPERRQQMKREITQRNIREHQDVWARLAPTDGNGQAAAKKGEQDSHRNVAAAD